MTTAKRGGVQGAALFSVLFTIIFFTIILMAGLPGVSADIQLQSPPDNDTLQAGEVSFQYSFRLAPALKNCSLVVDGKVAKTYGNPQPTGVVFKQNLEAGGHQWMIRCYDLAGNLYESQARTLVIEGQESSDSQGSEVKVTSDGLGTSGLRYSFDWYQSPGQQPVILDEILVNDIITLRNPHLTGLAPRAKEREFDIEILELRTYTSPSVLGYADENERTTQELGEGKSVEIDVDFDGVVDTRMAFKRIADRKAIIEFTFLGAEGQPSQPPEEIIEEQPEEVTEELTEPPTEEELLDAAIAEQQESVESSGTSADGESIEDASDGAVDSEADGTAGKSKGVLGIIVLIAVILLVITGIVLMAQGKAVRKPKTVKPEEKQLPEEHHRKHKK